MKPASLFILIPVKIKPAHINNDLNIWSLVINSTCNNEPGEGVLGIKAALYEREGINLVFIKTPSFSVYSISVQLVILWRAGARIFCVFLHNFRFITRSKISLNYWLVHPQPQSSKLEKKLFQDQIFPSSEEFNEHIPELIAADCEFAGCFPPFLRSFFFSFLLNKDF